MISTARTAARLRRPTIACTRVGGVLRSSLLFACLAAGATNLVAAAEAPAANSVTIDTGELRGKTQGEVVFFKGIPFARPPVGELRWKPPQPVEKWQGVRDASGYGADCGQPAWPAYDARSDLIMDFTNKGPVVGADPWQARLDVAEAFNLAHEPGAPGSTGR